MATELDDGKYGVDDGKAPGPELHLTEILPSSAGIHPLPTAVHRGLEVRHIQLIAISGAIGAGIFLSIASPLISGGPLALMIGIALWASVIWCFSDCLIEICTLLPVPGGYIYYAGRFLDPSARFASGWNNILGGLSFVCFELTAMNIIVTYWAPELHPAVMITVGLAALIGANAISVRVYGEIEFWISILKVILMLGLFVFTFITMLGGNPIHDRFGFRYWKKPGLFAATTAVGRIKGIWAALQWGAFAIAGPEFLSVVSGETKDPRRVMPRAFRSTIYRVIFFYLGSALCVTISTPYDSPELLGARASGAPGAASSPYIVSMNRLGVPVLPSIVNAVILTSVFSTASSFMFVASRVLHSLAHEGQAPKVFRRTNRYGTPYVAVGALALGSCLSYLSLSSSSAIVLTYFTNLTTACTLMTWITIGFTYLRFRVGITKQYKEHILPARGYLQPYSAWFGTIMACLALVFSGYYLMPAGSFTGVDFLFSYFGAFFFIFNLCLWKIKGVIQKTQRWGWIPAEEMDFESGLEEIEKLTAVYDHEREVQGPPKNFLAKVDRVIF